MKPTPVNIKNKRASFDYEFIDTYTAGIVLTGTEIKSIRLGKASLVDTYCFLPFANATTNFASPFSLINRRTGTIVKPGFFPASSNFRSSFLLNNNLRSRRAEWLLYEP